METFVNGTQEVSVLPGGTYCTSRLYLEYVSKIG